MAEKIKKQINAFKNSKPVEIFYTLKEDIANSVTHGIGAILSFLTLIPLIIFATWSGDPWRIAGFVVFGFSLFLVYLTSSLYHGITKPRVKQVFRILDHAAIYFLIAGTYTPIILVALRNPLGWALLGIVWVMAVAGVIHEIFFFSKMNWFSVPYYVLMGALILFAIKPLLEMVPLGMTIWLLVGGACYIVGLIFYAWERLPYNHAIWHLFVIGGSVCHVFAVFRFLV
ncbi:MAG: hemolysin III family protein [Candidatus Neomarinimicrobiota bacterium]